MTLTIYPTTEQTKPELLKAPDLTEQLLDSSRLFVQKTIRNPKFRAYMLDAIDLASEGDLTNMKRAANLRWMPVDIEEFLLGKHYMNAKEFLYPAVIEELIAMNAGGYVEILMVGGIGGAKTTCALYTLAYQIYKLSCMKSPHVAYQLDPHSEILTVFQSITATKAKQVGYDRFRSMIESCEYFHRHFMFNKRLESTLVFPHRIEVRPAGASEIGAIGENVIGGLIDELNYMAVTENSKQSIDGGTYDQAVAIYNSIARRRKSRFHELGDLPGVLCLVSSRRYPGQFTDHKEEEAKTDPTIYVYDKRVWDIKPEGTFTSGYFDVFVGDGTRKPRLIYEDEKISEPDEPLIDQIPNDFRNEFEVDIYDALREIAGKSTLARKPFILNTESISECMSNDELQSIFRDEWTDFDTATCYIMPKRMKDLEHPRWCHIDLGLTSDSAGIVIGYVKEFVKIDRGGTYETLPVIVIDGCLEVRPPRGGEIPFWKIRDLLYKLRDFGLFIKWVTLDSYQSVDTIQLLNAKGFKAGMASLDTDRSGYDFTKSALYDIRLQMPWHSKLHRELSSLEDIVNKGKIDHPPNGSKDCSDALAGVVIGLYRRMELWTKFGISLGQIPASVQAVLSSNKSN